MAQKALGGIDYERLGRRIKDARRQHELTQEQLAELVGVTGVHISNIENNYTKVSLDTVFRIANVLDTGLDALLNDQFEHAETIKDYGLIKELHGMSESSFELTETLIRMVADHDRKQRE